MSYEVEAMPESVTIQSVNPNQATAPVMREDRVVDPYAWMKNAKGAKAPPASSDAPIGQQDTIRESAPEETGKTEETLKLSPQVAALARREQKFRQQQQALEQERARIASEKIELEQMRALKQKLDAKDYSALDGLVNYDEYSQYKVNKLNGSDPVQEELAKMQSKISDVEKKYEESITKQFEAAVTERRNAAQELVSQSDQFPRIKKAGKPATEAIVQHILDTWEHDNKELSVQQAAKEVEEILTEKAKQWASLLEEEKKQEAPVAEKKPLPPMKAGLKTLTNQVTAGDFKTPNRPLHTLSDSERWAEARRRVLAREQGNKGA